MIFFHMFYHLTLLKLTLIYLQTALYKEQGEQKRTQQWCHRVLKCYKLKSFCFMNSHSLCRTLADVDKDGQLRADEFILAMHLVDMAKTGCPLPLTLPQDLVPPSLR